MNVQWSSNAKRTNNLLDNELLKLGRGGLTVNEI